MATRGPKLNLKLEVIDVLARLEAITASATKLPLTRRAVINPQEIQELVTQARNSLPTDINEAQQIIRYRDTLISQAQAEAIRLRADAEQAAMQKVSETQIMKDARVKAEDIRDEAQREGQDILAQAEKQATSRIDGADTYAMEVLTRLEEELTALLATARRGIESLRDGQVLEEAPRD